MYVGRRSTHVGDRSSRSHECGAILVSRSGTVLIPAGSSNEQHPDVMTQNRLYLFGGEK